MTSEHQSLKEEVEKLREVLHSEDETSASSVAGDWYRYVTDRELESDFQTEECQDGLRSNEDHEENHPKTLSKHRFRTLSASVEAVGDVTQSRENLEICLEMNLRYQKIIEDALCEIVKQQSATKSKREALEIKINVRKPLSRVRIDAFMPEFKVPYFSLHCGGSAPYNQDVVTKWWRNEIDPVMHVASYWKIKERKTLISSVRDEALTLALQPHINRLDVELDKYNTCGDMTEREQIRMRLAALKNKMTETRNMSNQELLMDVDSAKIDWTKISNRHLKQSHSAVSCELMWNNVLRPFINRNKWSATEITRLKRLAKFKCYDSWIDISRHLNSNRTPFQCLQYYEKYIREIADLPWTKEEDNMLQEVVSMSRMGDQIPWNQVCFYLEGRSPRACVWRYRTISAKTKRGRWTPEEDQMLLDAVNRHGVSSWVAIAQHIPNRLGHQCRERYTNQLDPQLVFTQWTEEEDIQLINLVIQYGYAWSRVSEFIPGRTDARCKSRFLRLMYFLNKKSSHMSPNVRKVLQENKHKIPTKNNKKKGESIHETGYVGDKEYDSGENIEKQFDADEFLKRTKLNVILGSLLRERYSSAKGRPFTYSNEMDYKIIKELRKHYPFESTIRLVEIAKSVCGDNTKHAVQQRKKGSGPRTGKSSKAWDLYICNILRAQKKQSNKQKDVDGSCENYDAVNQARAHLFNMLNVEINEKSTKLLKCNSINNSLPKSSASKERTTCPHYKDYHVDFLTKNFFDNLRVNKTCLSNAEQHNSRVSILPPCVVSMLTHEELLKSDNNKLFCSRELTLSDQRIPHRESALQKRTGSKCLRTSADITISTPVKAQPLSSVTPHHTNCQDETEIDELQVNDVGLTEARAKSSHRKRRLDNIKQTEDDERNREPSPDENIEKDYISDKNSLNSLFSTATQTKPNSPKRVKVSDIIEEHVGNVDTESIGEDDLCHLTSDKCLSIRSESNANSGMTERNIFGEVIDSEEFNKLKDRFIGIYLWPYLMGKIRLPRYSVQDKISLPTVVTPKDGLVFPNVSLRPVPESESMPNRDNSHYSTSGSPPPENPTRSSEEHTPTILDYSQIKSPNKIMFSSVQPVADAYSQTIRMGKSRIRRENQRKTSTVIRTPNTEAPTTTRNYFCELDGSHVTEITVYPKSASNFTPSSTFIE